MIIKRKDKIYRKLVSADLEIGKKVLWRLNTNPMLKPGTIIGYTSSRKLFWIGNNTDCGATLIGASTVMEGWADKFKYSWVVHVLDTGMNFPVYVEVKEK